MTKKKENISLYVKQVMEQNGRKPTAQPFVKLGFSRNVVNHILSGESKTIKLDMLFELCRFLQCTPNDLLTLTDEGSKLLPPNHPLQALKKADNPRKPIDLVKALPHHKVAKVNEFLQKLLHGDDSDLES
jgi:DNA-binding Xre family transcriptional regulator